MVHPSPSKHESDWANRTDREGGAWSARSVSGGASASEEKPKARREVVRRGGKNNRISPLARETGVILHLQLGGPLPLTIPCPFQAEDDEPSPGEIRHAFPAYRLARLLVA